MIKWNFLNFINYLQRLKDKYTGIYRKQRKNYTVNYFKVNLITADLLNSKDCSSSATYTKYRTQSKFAGLRDLIILL